MNKKRVIVGTMMLALIVVGVSVYAQDNRPYHNGSVWSIAFIRMKPGMETAYMDYLAGPWKGEQEAQ